MTRPTFRRARSGQAFQGEAMHHRMAPGTGLAATSETRTPGNALPSAEGTSESTPGLHVSEQPETLADLTASAMRLTLNAQLALTGELVAFLVAREGMRRDQVISMITKLADTMTSSLGDSAASDAHAVLLMPLREHADALRRIARDLQSDAG